MMEHNQRLLLSSSSPIFGIANNWMANCRKLRPDLMISARMQPDGDIRTRIHHTNGFVGKQAPLASFGATHGLAISMHQPMFKHTARLCQHALYKRYIALLKLTLAQSFLQTAKRFRGFCKEHYSRHHAIQAMHGMQKYIARLMVGLFYI